MDSKKQKFLTALRASQGQLEEYDLGNRLGLTEGETRQAIKELEKEGKIEYQSFGLCNYVVAL
ncbi:hypothetical protein [Hymenobacter crusticola]|uniref:MarR family transcriptional regulator n=1 Tax=Hymenobacter crusticola TaxID=1770526 RepID=A0A243W6F2_9BACT|nr:hypothetical protein [Hymenobacter crusticola]OUJ67354.1 hypothetical protein BXP70_28895 [Hymenobacter crusticola]